MDRTEAQLREKLLNAEFAPALVEQAVAYVKSYGYLDDERYVRNYIEYRKDQKSRRQLEQELRFKKGVPSELIQKVYEELEPGFFLPYRGGVLVPYLEGLQKDLDTRAD